MAAPGAPRYDVIRFLGQGAGAAYASEAAHALVAVFPLGEAVSWDRSSQESFSDDVAAGVRLRARPLLIADEVTDVQVERSKAQHVKTASVSLRHTPALLRTVLPGDWAMVWLVPDRSGLEDLLARARDGRPCNLPQDGLRLVGRVHEVRKNLRMLADGKRDMATTLQLVGFSEFDALLYYDLAVATNDVLQQSVGRWLTRVGVDADAWFAKHKTEGGQDNINTIVPAILDLVLGQGVSSDLNAGAGEGLSAAAGAGADENAPNAYLVPNEVGRLLGVLPSGKALSFGELIDPLVGVQAYKAGKELENFVPNSVQALSGSFLPFFPQLINTPFWSVLQQFLNPSVNEMYTALRLTIQDGRPAVAPTLVVRQIPFTTEAFESDRVEHVTKFLSLPRWVISPTLVVASSLGRSDARRCNLVHVYGAASQLAGNMNITRQLVENPPLRDDLDIQRSGPRPIMQVVECGADAEDVKTSQAGKWMDLVADWSMTAHMTLNGTIETVGLPGPVAEGDNVECDGVVYHVESVSDSYHVDGNVRQWRTTLRVTNGVLADSDDEFSLHLYGIGDDGNPSVDVEDPGEGGLLRHGRGDG